MLILHGSSFDDRTYTKHLLDNYQIAFETFKTFARQRLNFSYPALQDRWGIEMEGHHAVCLGAVFYLVQTKVVAGKQIVNRLVFTSDSEIPAL